MLSRSYKSLSTIPKSIRSYATQPAGKPSPQSQPDRSHIGPTKSIPGPGLKLPSNNVLLGLGILSLGGGWYYMTRDTRGGAMKKMGEK